MYNSTLQSFSSQILKIVNIMNLFLCTMCITIELWSSIEKLSKGMTPFCVVLYFFVLVTAFIVKRHNGSTAAF